jgi:hypothetical protein
MVRSSSGKRIARVGQRRAYAEPTRSARSGRCIAVEWLDGTQTRILVSSSSSLDLAARRPVWQALSTLFLDTDVSLDLEYRARVLAESPYTLGELEEILIDEVYPVCRANLLDMAGEWGGFDPAWLEDSILQRRRSPRRPLHRLHIGRLTVPRWKDWIETKKAVASIQTSHGRVEQQLSRDGSDA